MSIDLTKAVAGSAWRTCEGEIVYCVLKYDVDHAKYVFTDGVTRDTNGRPAWGAWVSEDYIIVEYVGPPYEELLKRLQDAEAELEWLWEVKK